MINIKATNYFYGVGRRKSSTARCKYYPESEKLEILVNKSEPKKIFPDFYIKNLEIALNNLGITSGKFDFFVNGGGISGQSEACRLAMAKALLKNNESYKPLLRMHGYLTTDIRKVLPKKAGLRKNRKREQWSKR